MQCTKKPLTIDTFVCNLRNFVSLVGIFAVSGNISIMEIKIKAEVYVDVWYNLLYKAAP